MSLATSRGHGERFKESNLYIPSAWDYWARSLGRGRREGLGFKATFVCDLDSFSFPSATIKEELVLRGLATLLSPKGHSLRLSSVQSPELLVFAGCLSSLAACVFFSVFPGKLPIEGYFSVAFLFGVTPLTPCV